MIDTKKTRNDIAISVKGVSKSFKLPHERHDSLKGRLLSSIKNTTKKGKGYEMQKVLNDISFEIKKGEFFGIVGRNGSGKSTLLKTIAQIYTPDKGEVSVNGRLVPFIELGVGFNPNLSGRDNVYLNGALFGLSRKEMDDLYDDIVEFAELEKFMDQKLKNYSSGMQVRLAFSIAIRAKGDILLLDEVLAVGDESFQRKCNEYFKVIKGEKKTIILVTHAMANIQNFCDRGIVINDGAIIEQGDVDKVVATYSLINMENKHNKTNANNSIRSSKAKIQNITLNKKSKNIIVRTEDDMTLSFTFKVSEPLKVTAGLSIIRSDNNYVTYYSTKGQLGAVDCTPNQKGYNATLRIDPQQLGSGSYRVDIALYDAESEKTHLARESSAIQFVVENSDVGRGGSLYLKGKWGISSG